MLERAAQFLLSHEHVVCPPLHVRTHQQAALIEAEASLSADTEFSGTFILGPFKLPLVD